MPKLRAEKAEMTHIEAIKKTAATWKTMGDAEKKPFVDRGKDDLGKYTAERESLISKGYFMLPDGRKSTDLHIPEDGEPSPKSPRSAYAYFTSDHLKKFKEEEGLSMIDATKKSAKKWESLSAAEKEPYL